jgi:hypothetical protein
MTANTPDTAFCIVIFTAISYGETDIDLYLSAGDAVHDDLATKHERKAGRAGVDEILWFLFRVHNQHPEKYVRRGVDHQNPPLVVNVKIGRGETVRNLAQGATRDFLNLLSRSAAKAKIGVSVFLGLLDF